MARVTSRRGKGGREGGQFLCSRSAAREGGRAGMGSTGAGGERRGRKGKKGRKKKEKAQSCDSKKKCCVTLSRKWRAGSYPARGEGTHVGGTPPILFLFPFIFLHRVFKSFLIFFFYFLPPSIPPGAGSGGMQGRRGARGGVQRLHGSCA